MACEGAGSAVRGSGHDVKSNDLNIPLVFSSKREFRLGFNRDRQDIQDRFKSHADAFFDFKTLPAHPAYPCE